MPGYITEKIFDSFFAGCVPVYLGADNITEHIPKECFIDKREFDTYEKLYKYLKNMSDEEYVTI
ncbi:glycosyltransferase family 10 domain-containing protein [Poseidonibacter ostreae]|uniref:glycosyltransferase family 10 domain-containing protein n=1 Tax=Poseidonibacter ostreae TaxID=2654171 RepID=UPI001D00741F